MRYKLLGRSGLRVSELCLGTMTFGEDWGWGADKATSQQIFDTFAAAGGNFIDTANNYTNGTSEQFVGEFIHSERDRFAVATKYTLRLTTGNSHNINLGGNSRKSMMQSVENSLRRLNTDYIDLLYLHMWDFTTPVMEVMRGLDDLVRAGKVLYVGFSDTPAWIVSYAVALAEQHGWSCPVALQLPYSALDRSPERAEFSMAAEFDLALLAWGVLEGGALTGKYNDSNHQAKRYEGISDKEREMAETVMALAQEINRTPAQVALNWVRQQSPRIIPIIGARTVAQIEDNLKVMDFALTAEQLERLSEAADFSLGFPLSFLKSSNVRNLIFGESFVQVDNHHIPV